MLRNDPYAADAATPVDTSHRVSGMLDGVACARETSCYSAASELVAPVTMKHAETM